MKNYGFKDPIETDDNFLLGSYASLPKEVINPSGDWSELVPEFEPQAKRFETYNCTGFNTNIPIRILLKKMGIDFNPSDRFTGICAGTKAGGNDPHTVAQSIRHNGLIPEEMLPFSDDLQTIDDYFSFKGASESKCRREGKRWLDKYSFGHEYVFKGGRTDTSKMMEALRYSPLGVSVLAWKKRDGLFFKNKGERDNHWTVAIVGYVKDKYWLIADTYLNDGEPLKKLEWDYPFQWCKRYSINKKVKTRLTLREFFKRYLCEKFKNK